MKKRQFAPFSAANWAAMAMIGTALVLMVFLIMSLLGLIHPRKTWITLATEHVTYVYDGSTHKGTEPIVHRGQLLPGHSIETRDLPRVQKAGTYENQPQFAIIDQTGADVTDYYEIRTNWGELTVERRTISLTCTGGSKLYDGSPLQANNLRQVSGDLAPGESLVVDGYNEILLPGTVTATPYYRIVTEAGVDVTDQYDVMEVFPHLTVQPHKIYIETGSAEQTYDGKSLTCNQWTQTGGSLLAGHTMQVRVTGSQTDTGVAENTAEVRFFDATGQDVTQIYNVSLNCGSLSVHQLPLYLRTGTAQKVYDGEALTCGEYSMTGGKLIEGDTLTVKSLTKLDRVGTVENAIGFAVLDESGADVTHRYNILCDYGSLTLQPISIRIKTASATKVYDGTALMDSSYKILSGQLVEGDTLVLECTQLEEIGYTENIVISYSVYRTVDGNTRMDVTANYRISMEYGSLEITAD